MPQCLQKLSGDTHIRGSFRSARAQQFPHIPCYSVNKGLEAGRALSQTAVQADHLTRGREKKQFSRAPATPTVNHSKNQANTSKQKLSFSVCCWRAWVNRLVFSECLSIS